MTQPATASTAAPLGGAPVLSQRQIYAIFSGLLAGIFLAALDQTIVATSIRTIADDLQGLELQAWATTAYLITATITTPLYGKLSDIYGRKPLFVIAITVFVVGSALCAFATSMYSLAGFRALQGVGAGGLFSLALAIVGDLVPPRERARYQGFFLAVFGTSSVLGPLVGGFFAGQDSVLGVTGWRWVFLVNVPIGIMALVIVWFTLRMPHVVRPHRIDVLGALALAGGLVPLLIVAEQGRQWGWSSPGVIGLIVMSVVLLLTFVYVESRMGDDALLPLRLFRLPVFAVGSAASLVVGMAMFGGLALLPLYLQVVKLQTPTQAGLALLPLTLGIMIGALTSGQLISRTGKYKAFPVIGSVLLVVALVLMAQIGADTSYWLVAGSMVLFGLGLGGNMQPVVLAVQNTVPPTEIGVATSSVTFFRQMGGTLGTAVFLSVLFSTVGDRISAAFRAASTDPSFQAAIADPAVIADPANAGVLAGVSGGAGSSADMASQSAVLSDSSFLSVIDPRLAQPFRVGFSESMDLVFWLAAGIMLIGLLIIAFLPEHPLRHRSALQERTDDAAEAAAAAENAGAGRRAITPAAG